MDIEDLRLAVYDRFRHARRPSATVLAEDLSASVAEVRAGLVELAVARHLALAADGEIAMVHPFTAVPLGFSVMGSDTLWWGGCAWDSFALPQLFPKQGPMLVATSCPACEAAHAWRIDNRQPPEGDQVAHFPVPLAHMWDDVVFTCRHQRLFCAPACVDRWLTASGNRRGYVLDLSTLWQLASDWYTGRLERGYTRRDPSAAADYLPFCGCSTSAS